MTKIENELSSLKQALRIEVDGKWRLDQLSSLIETMCYFYDFFLLLDSDKHEIDYFIGSDIYEKFNKIHFNSPTSLATSLEETKKSFYRDIFLKYFSISNKFKIEKITPELHKKFPNEIVRLNLLSVEISSPGHIDFTGLGIAIGHLKDLIIQILDRFLNRDLRKLKSEELKENIEKQKIENLKSFQNLIDNSPLTDRQKNEIFIQALHKQDILVESVIERKILDIKNISSDLNTDI